MPFMLSLALGVGASVGLPSAAVAGDSEQRNDGNEEKNEEKGWGELDDETVLDQRLQAAHLAAKRWHWTWGTLFIASGVTQGVLIAFEDNRDDRLSQSLRVVPPVVGTALLFATPLKALSWPDDARLLNLTITDPEQRKLAKQELLHRYAASEAKKRNWFAHVGPLLLHSAIAGTLLWAFDDPVGAGLQLGIGMTISEIKNLTAPRVASRAVEGKPHTEATRRTIQPVLSLGYVGLRATWP